MGVVQDGQSSRREDREDRGDDRDEVRRQDRDQERQEVRNEAVGGRGAEPADSQERGVILRRLVTRWRAVLESFFADDCPFLAGAVAYQIFFGLIPLLALIVGVLGFIYGPDRAQREIVQIIREIYPSATAQETRIARELVQGRAISLGFGVFGTVLSATAVRNSLELALAAVLGREGRRTFLRGHLETAAFLAGIAALAVTSFGLSYGVAALSGMLVEAGFGRVVSFALPLLSPLAGLLFGYVFFYLVYRALPRRRVTRRVAASAALVSALLWEVAKLAFGYFTRALSLFAAYGPLAFAAGLLTWIYLTAVIILIGAEVVKTRGTA
ncbi:MAG: YihY/virulence factor BrkB family protein [Chloroflexi bacterium]|nr:MAG: YihY/virulence factor BrkB family protein [Chloroflexota bacterium]